MLKRSLILIYGVAAYVLFLGTFLYAMGFTANVFVPKSIDSGVQEPLWQAILIDACLLLVFAMQHSIMARPWFKRAWTKIVPKPAERSTFVLFTCGALALMFWQWRPMGGLVWNIENEQARVVVQALCGLGWATVLVATFLIDHFDLFGLRQVWLYFRNQPYKEHGFRTPFLYKFLRHPIYLGFILAFWMTPAMSPARLFFAVMTTAYILVAIRFEEHDLIMAHGERYKKYREQVPMLIPAAKPPRPVEAAVAESRG
jgi:protein-S-isoprenylcysteine O-methyltransferase Ste14